MRETVHRFAWDAEYVTLDKFENNRTRKYAFFFITESCCRFYRSRYGLLSEFDSLGIELDEEMWFSLTPEGIAKQHSKRISDSLSCGIILDLFCGIGGDLIRFEKSFFAIGCDIQECRVRIASGLHAKLGQCKADFVVANSMGRKSCFRNNSFDVVYLSPPWGHAGIRNRHVAPVYGRRGLKSLEVNGFHVFKKALSLTKQANIAFFLPRGMDLNDLHQLSRMTGKEESSFIEIHESFDPDDETANEQDRFRVRAVTVYFGQLAVNN